MKNCLRAEIADLRAQLQGRVPAVRGVSLPGQTAAEISAQVDLEIKTVQELIDLDIWAHKKTRFYCTVTVVRLSPGERWWFHACTACGHGTIPCGSAYKCPNKECGATGGAPRYRICYVGSDGTADVDLVFFDKAGKELLGKAALTIMCSKAPKGVSVEDAIQFARTDQSTPRELASVVGRKYRLVVSVTTKSFDAKSEKPAYQVHRIDMQHERQPRAAALGRRPGLTLASTSSSSGGGGLSPAGEVLADSLLGQSKSSDSLAALSDAPASTDIAAATAGSESILPFTPPSVTKPLGASGCKTPIDSNVKKALFQESAEHEEETVEEVATLPLAGKATLPVVDAPDSPSASPAAAADKTPLKRRQAASKVDGSDKNKKAQK